MLPLAIMTWQIANSQFVPASRQQLCQCGPLGWVRRTSISIKTIQAVVPSLGARQLLQLVGATQIRGASKVLSASVCEFTETSKGGTVRVLDVSLLQSDDMNDMTIKLPPEEQVKGKDLI